MTNGCTTAHPYRLIVTDDPAQTLGQGRMTHYATMLAAANAFVKSPAPYKQVLYDDGCTAARELNAREEALLTEVCDRLGYIVEDAS